MVGFAGVLFAGFPRDTMTVECKIESEELQSCRGGGCFGHSL